MIEARLEDHQPAVATERAEILKHSFNGAIDRLTRMIDSIIRRIHITEQSVPVLNFPDEK